ncbi:cytoplasm protein, partial [Dendrothele bispora CBS 962.96]
QNDDGPPDHKESPYIFGLYKYLTQQLGWNVKVVIPSSQKSWIGILGKAYQIQEITKGRYYYPTEPDGLGETSPVSRSLRENEVAEWVLLDSTPATCSNIGLFNLYPGQIDLVISGPNLGRNSSSAFALSSGTLGAAMSSSLSKVRSIALSYGTVHHPTPSTYFEPAHLLGSKIIKYLWDNWGADDGGLKNGEIDLYSVNIPLIEGLLSEESLKIYWTTMWRSSYGRLFKPLPTSGPVSSKVNPGGPDASSTAPSETVKIPPGDSSTEDLFFKWSPDVTGLVQPSPASLPATGSDSWALYRGGVSVTPLRASFAEPRFCDLIPNVEDRVWKMKL